MQFDQDTKKLVVPLEGSIDYNSASEFEGKVVSLVDEYDAERIEFDAAEDTGAPP